MQENSRSIVKRNSRVPNKRIQKGRGGNFEKGQDKHERKWDANTPVEKEKEKREV